MGFDSNNSRKEDIQNISEHIIQDISYKLDSEHHEQYEMCQMLFWIIYCILFKTELSAERLHILKNQSVFLYKVLWWLLQKF